jgi:peptidoglycan hydrolase-like protein with peptidoglycan-binding domain
MRSRQTTLTVMLIVGILALADTGEVQAFVGEASRQTLMVMQRCLTSLGYDTGGVTGTWNTQTETMAFRYASSKDLNPYTDSYRVGQLLILDCATEAVHRNDQAMLAEISQLGSYAAPDSPGASLASMQRCLRDMGFDPGPIDGIRGPRTEAALMRWAAQRRLLGGDYTPNQITAMFMADCARTMAGTPSLPPALPQFPLYSR